jgi:hypothetical protein
MVNAKIRLQSIYRTRCKAKRSYSIDINPVLHSIVQALLPVAFVVLLGWSAVALKALRREHAGILATRVVTIGLTIALVTG